MPFQWDENKAKSNKRKHGIDFADAVAVLEDESALTMADTHPEEERFITMGMDAFGRVLVVVYTYRDDDIRFISARKSTGQERVTYESK